MFSKYYILGIIHFTSLKIHTDLRDQLARVKTFQDIDEIVQEMKKRIIVFFQLTIARVWRKYIL